MSDPKYVTDFIKQVYPESTELAMALNTEKSLLIDATNLIKELKSSNRRLEMKVARLMNDIKATDYWLKER